MVRERTVEIGGHAVRYLESGAGWPVLLIHAFPLNADMWRPQLERTPEDWRLIAPDLPGFGGTTRVGGAVPSMDGFAADATALLDALEIERAVIGGLSMGGYVAFALLRKAPERFSGVLLANTRPQADTAEGVAGRQKMSELVRSAGPRGVADEMLPKLLGATAFRDNPDLVRRVRSLIESNGADGIDDAIHAMMRRPDSTAMLPSVSMPALVIAGEEDGIIPPSDAEAMNRQLPRSRLVVLPHAGHLSNMEAPEEFSRALGDFLTANM